MIDSLCLSRGPRPPSHHPEDPDLLGTDSRLLRCDARLRALETLRGLSADRVSRPSEAECAAFEVVQGALSAESCHGELESGCMALLTLACRNGFRASGFLDLAELVSGQLEAGIIKQLERSDTHELSLLRAASAVKHVCKNVGARRLRS